VQLAQSKLPDPLTKAESLARGLKFKVGEWLPAIQVHSVSGEVANLRDIVRPSRRTIVNLWATWCIPCVKEMPELSRLRAAFAQNGVDLLGLNVDTDPDAHIREFLQKVPVDYPIYKGGVAAIEQLFATDEVTVPLSVVVDQNGKVEQLISGWSSETKQKFEALTGSTTQH
jgi:thiol-disulfide isomerase/thioredoxin